MSAACSLSQTMPYHESDLKKDKGIAGAVFARVVLHVLLVQKGDTG